MDNDSQVHLSSQEGAGSLEGSMQDREGAPASGGPSEGGASPPNEIEGSEGEEGEEEGEGAGPAIDSTFTSKVRTFFLQRGGKLQVGLGGPREQGGALAPARRRGRCLPSPDVAHARPPPPL